MAKKPDSGKDKSTDKIVEKAYRDYDLYDWSGKKTDSGADVRRKGSDR